MQCNTIWFSNRKFFICSYLESKRPSLSQAYSWIKSSFFVGIELKPEPDRGETQKNICPFPTAPKSTKGIIKVTEFGSKILSFATLCHNWLEGGCNCATEMNTSWGCHLDFLMLLEIRTNKINFTITWLWLWSIILGYTGCLILKSAK